MIRHIPFLALPLLLFFLSPTAGAQFAQRGALPGTVFNSSGAVVPGAQVTLLDPAQKQTRQMTADSVGHFEFDNLTAGQCKTVSDYPWSNTLGANGSPGAGGGRIQYPNLFDRGETTGSHRQRFVYRGIWSPQYGGNWPHWAKMTLTGWRISGIATLESGDALTVTNGGPGTPCPASDAGTATCPSGCGSSAQDGAGFDELNVSGNPNDIGHWSKTAYRQFDTSKFSVPPMNVRGNSGLGTVRGPGQNNLDLSLAKTFSIYENLHLEFRGDAFNALNHTQ